MSYRFIDLFSGIGGMRLGFEGTGGRCVWSCDHDKFCQITYRENFGETPAGDINGVDISKIPEFDILCAGFPCQPFSIAGVSKKISLGKKHGFGDSTQGTLFFNIAAIIAYHRPRAFLLENVSNLKHHDKGKTYAVIKETLENSLNYKVYDRIINAKSLVPQNRNRIFFVGFRDNKTDFRFPEIPEKNPKLKNILEENVPDKYTLTDHLWSYLQSYAAKHRALGNGFGFGIADPEGITRTLSARYHKDGSEILIPQKGKNPRRLTPRECARLLGFDEDFKIRVSDTQAYRQFGNSVAVPVVALLAEEIVKTLKRSVPAKLHSF